MSASLGRGEGKEKESLYYPHVKIVAADASEEVLTAAAAAAAKGYYRLLNNEIQHWRDFALFLKCCMQDACGGTWHAIAGTHFGAFITHQIKSMLYLQVAQVNVLLFRHG